MQDVSGAKIPPYYSFTWSRPDVSLEWWHVALGGFLNRPELRREPHQGSSLALAPAERPQKWTAYKPLAEFTGLFLAFAYAQPPSASGIAAFTSKYGPLEDFRTNASDQDAVNTPWGEPVRPQLEEAWAYQHQRMSQAVAAWRAAFSSPNRVLAQQFEQVTSGEFLFRVGWTELRITLEPGEALDYRAAALAAVRHEINQTLTQRLAAHVTPTLAADDVVLMPTTLLGALWLQFALAVVRGKSYRECEAHACPRGWFEISTDPYGLRTDAQFCSDRCRSRAKARRRTHPGEDPGRRLYVRGDGKVVAKRARPEQITPPRE